MSRTRCSVSKGRYQFQALAQLAYRFKHRGTRRRFPAGNPPIRNCFFGQPCFSEVTRQQLGLALCEIAELVFDSFSDPGVKHTSRLAEQSAIGRVPH